MLRATHKSAMNASFNHLDNLTSTAVKAPLEMCRVDKVNVNEYTVRAYFFTSGMTVDNVPFCFPYNNLDKGMVFMPEVGAIGIAFWAYRNDPIIVSFIAPSFMTANGSVTRVSESLKDFNLEPLNEGELLFMSSGRGFIKIDSSGSVLISTPLFNYIKLDELLSSIYINSENLVIDNELNRVTSGIMQDSSGNSVQFGEEEDMFNTNGKELIYDKSDNTINLDENSSSNIAEIMEIQKGNVFDTANDGTVSKVSSTSGELSYRVRNNIYEVKVSQGGGNGFIILASDSSVADNYYYDWTVEIINDLPVGVQGQKRTITGYTGNDKKALIDTDWVVMPTSESIYKIEQAKSVIEIDKSGKIYLGNRDSAYKRVARVGDSVTINVGGINYTGTITSGSSTTLASD